MRIVGEGEERTNERKSERERERDRKTERENGGRMGGRQDCTHNTDLFGMVSHRLIFPL